MHCVASLGIPSLDTGSIAFLNAGFAELRRKIAESIARLNSLEFGAGTMTA
jgi:hypothetical protein